MPGPKSTSSYTQRVEGWKAVGKAAWDDPWGMVVPGVMEAWRNPSSAEAWGKAAVDLGLIAFSVAKMGGAASRVGRAAAIGEELTTAGKAGSIASEMLKLENLIAGNGKELFHFSSKAAEHMANPVRAVPVQVLQDAIKHTKGIADPRGSSALMYYTEMWKNGQKYNLEILYDKTNNSIWHFQYSRDAMGSLPAISKP